MRFGDLPASDRSRKEVDTGNGIVIVEGSPVFLFCPGCDSRFSATRGDYFMELDDTLIPPCGECGTEMFLAREETRIIEVESDV